MKRYAPILLLACAVLTVPPLSEAQGGVPPAFSGLVSVTSSGDTRPEGVYVHYNPSLSEAEPVVLGGVYNPLGRFLTDLDLIRILGRSERMLETALAPGDSMRYSVVFNRGLSNDPHFLLFAFDGSLDAAGDSARFCGATAVCTDIFIPGDGFIYTIGHVAAMFDTCRKYAIRDGKLTEIVQPMRYVGIESVTTKKVTLTRTKGGADSVAVLDAGTKVTVLVNDGEDYLVLTPQWITGWLKIAWPATFDTTPIRDLMYRSE
jgi:hypothetical protein